MSPSLEPGDTRVTIYATEDVLVERLLPDGRWEQRQYTVDAYGFIAEVYGTGAMRRTGPGLGSVQKTTGAAVLVQWTPRLRDVV